MSKKTILVPVIICVLSVLSVTYFNFTQEKHEYEGLKVEQLIEKFGYPAEVHEVVTEDGYILTLHRIPHGRKKTPQVRPPILFVHPFSLSSMDYVHFGPNNSLSFLLAERGFDVWMGNVRGTTWSRKHKTLDPDRDSAYWDFTLYELGIYDIPALIDHVLTTTNHDSLQCVAYSQSASLFLTMQSEKPQYIEKIKLLTAFAPAVFMKDPKSPVLRYLAGAWELEEKVFNALSMHEIFNTNGVLASYFRFICSGNKIFVDLCLHHVFVMFGYSYDELDMSLIPLFSLNTPNGISLKQMIHTFQMIQTGNFQKYDYGLEKNLELYGQEQPPHYDLSEITTPVALYYADNDWAVNIKNMGKLVRALPNVVKEYQVPLATFNHYDFISAKNVVNLLYNTVIETILEYR
ncbi:hypothetical protein Zmor_010137 [Zophobas morio]|uniref:Lipase n=1 Tax=Zophobas morio TaxID=2755281 RepID=A0AA38IJW8_9CUCU|nr:hypothetical protein Zmor_010137 [Zophobas morio]